MSGRVSASGPGALVIRSPQIADGQHAWRIAHDSQILDLNSAYTYLLFFRDFGATCRIALVDGVVAGFVLGYRAPGRPATLFIWQIAVAERFRGRGIAGRMLDDLIPNDLALAIPVTMVETTINDKNPASQALFRAFAKRRGDSPIQATPLFAAADFPAEHEPEALYLIGPLGPPATRTAAARPR